MKNTRRAAAAWMTMSLAVSTVLGNTAWGDVLQETGKNRCVHVHTAECYGDADETATMSQTGELEPTECTHVCSVESGCILDTEDLENNDADAWKVGTPSNAEDTTINPGGTVTPAVQTKILSWSWFDPEENLLDGKLELTGITEEAQPSFTEVTEYLPQAIIAQVGEGEDWEEKNLQITNWVCTEYVQDEEGRWPLEGTYEFRAELPEGYELAEGVDALVVEVSVVGDQAVMLATTPLMSVMKDGIEKSIYWDENNYSGSYNELASMGISLRYVNGYHYLTLNKVDMNSLYLGNWSQWIITLEGTNTLDVTSLTTKGTDALMIAEGTTVTIEGNGTLNAYGRNTGSGINLGGTLTIESGTINASASKSLGGTDDGKASGILIGTNGKLQVKGGDITASGTKAGRNTRYGMYVRGQFIMTGGKMKVIGNDCQGLYTMGQFKLSGGEMAVSSKAGLLGFVAAGDSTAINAPGKLTVDILDIAPGKTVTVKQNATLTVDGVKLEKGSTLVNNGNLTVNREVDDRDGGTLENNGTISGSGSIPDSAKQTPTGIAGYTAEIRAVYSENTLIDVQQLANIQRPANAGALQYELVNYTGSESKGEGTIDESKGLLTVKKAGVFNIQVKTLASGLYKEGTPVTITLTVDKADFPNTWTVNLDAASGVYNGAEGYPAATIEYKSPGIPADARYEYQLAATKDSSTLLEDQWKSECPKIVNVNESGKYVFVRVLTDNYQPGIFVSGAQTEITRRSFASEVTVTIDPSTYNGENQNPKIKVVENWNGSSGNELKEDVDYTIKWWVNENREIVDERKNAGKYTVTLVGKGNYTAQQNEAIFTINKCKLKSQMEGGPLDKVYDGTTNVTEEQKVLVTLSSDSGVPAFQDIHVDQVKYAYQSADVGEHYIDATIIALAGDQLDNYELTNATSSLKGVIKSRDFASMTVSAAPLTYNGTEQQPKINASVETGLENVSPDAVFTYSKDGVDYQSEIPGFTEAGTYLVYVKASMANFNDEVKTVAVTVTPKESSSGGNSGNDSGNNSGSNSGNNSGTSTSGGSSSNNGNSGSGNSGNGSSGSDRDRSDRDDSNTSVVKVSPGQSGKVTKDSQKGYRNEEQGVITGANNQAVNDGYSHWMKDAKGWWLRYSDGTWPMGRAGAYHWEKINGRWWAFGADGYISSGWIYDTIYQGWFYMDENQGMLTGWQFINGKWYYLNHNSDGTAGIMYTKRRTPDGWYVKEDGSWDEEAGR